MRWASSQQVQTEQGGGIEVRIFLQFSAISQFFTIFGNFPQVLSACPLCVLVGAVAFANNCCRTIHFNVFLAQKE